MKVSFKKSQAFQHTAEKASSSRLTPLGMTSLKSIFGTAEAVPSRQQSSTAGLPQKQKPPALG